MWELAMSLSDAVSGLMQPRLSSATYVRTNTCLHQVAVSFLNVALFYVLLRGKEREL
jgi:hypothetical protein